jgi:hypothetical protein
MSDCAPYVQFLTNNATYQTGVICSIWIGGTSPAQTADGVLRFFERGGAGSADTAPIAGKGFRGNVTLPRPSDDGLFDVSAFEITIVMSRSEVKVHMRRGKTRADFTPDCTASARMIGTAVDLFSPQNEVQYTINLYGPYELPAIK